MFFDRFDIVSAHYAFCCDWYNGQRDKLYARLCRIGNYYKPSVLDKGYVSLSENGKDIYAALCEKHGFDHRETCEECGSELDKDCQGEFRCDVCDEPCPHCSDS